MGCALSGYCIHKPNFDLALISVPTPRVAKTAPAIECISRIVSLTNLSPANKARAWGMYITKVVLIMNQVIADGFVT